MIARVQLGAGPAEGPRYSPQMTGPSAR